MGERKRKLERMTPVERMAEELTHRLLDEGKIMEAGFVGFMASCFPDEQPSEIQRQEMRNAFMAGATHLFTSIIAGMTEDDEPTEKDFERLNQISEELVAFSFVLEERAAKALQTKGSA